MNPSLSLDSRPPCSPAFVLAQTTSQTNVAPSIQLKEAARLVRTQNMHSADSNSPRHADEFRRIGMSWMRVNGALQDFKNVLSPSPKQRPASSCARYPPNARNISQTSDDPSLATTVTIDQAVETAKVGRASVLNYASVDTHGSTEVETGSRRSKSANASLAKFNGVQKSAVSSRLGRRQDLYTKRRRCSDYALAFALIGIVMMIVESELSAVGYYTKSSVYSYLLKSIILLSTLVLLGLILLFHCLEIKLFMNDNSAEDWRIGINAKRMNQIVVELAICVICPFPGDFSFKWTTIHSDGKTVTSTDVPLDVVFSIPMFFRMYLIGRVMLLHSRLFTDATSRSIGALNRVNFNARFVLKTLMTLCPGTVLLVFTATFWMIAGWILRLCERYHVGEIPPYYVEAVKHQNYLNSLWLIAITFLSVGYGDLVPNTYCGRAVAVITGIMGAGTASMVVAVIARKLELSSAEKHVHNFMMDTQLTKKLKHAAANVLRETWLIYKHRRLIDKLEPGKIRLHQRKFLLAIYELRKVKRDQRKLAENSMTVDDIVKTSTTTFEMVSELHNWHEGLEERLVSVEENLQAIQRDIQLLLRHMSDNGSGLRKRHNRLTTPNDDAPAYHE